MEIDFNINTYQKLLNEWQRKNFGVVPPVMLALGLTKEAGKVSGAILDNSQNLTPFETPTEHVERTLDALSSVIIYCLQLYSAYNVNAEESLSDMFEYILSLDKNKLISCKFGNIEDQNSTSENEESFDLNKKSIFER